MQLFYEENITEKQMNLSGETMRHIVQVLRMKIGDTFLLTNGLGLKCEATIIAIDKKECTVSIANSKMQPKAQTNISLAISFTKNANRIEWMLEKITEIGVHNIYPIITKRTEQLYPKYERLQTILIAAMCQSKQFYLPKLHKAMSLQECLVADKSEQNFIAHCMSGEPTKALIDCIQKNKSSLICIGPEGDFTKDEVSLCLQNGCEAVSLGDTRLRTETAGLVAVTLLNFV